MATTMRKTMMENFIKELNNEEILFMLTKCLEEVIANDAGITCYEHYMHTDELPIFLNAINNP